MHKAIGSRKDFSRPDEDSLLVGDEGNVKGEIFMIKIYSKLTVANIKNQRMCFRCYM